MGKRHYLKDNLWLEHDGGYRPSYTVYDGEVGVATVYFYRQVNRAGVHIQCRLTFIESLVTIEDFACYFQDVKTFLRTIDWTLPAPASVEEFRQNLAYPPEKQNVTPEDFGKIGKGDIAFEKPIRIISDLHLSVKDGVYINITSKTLNEIAEGLDKLAASDTDNFVELTILMGLDPATAYAGADLSGVDLSDCKLAGFNFRRCNLTGITWNRGTDFTGAILDEAVFDPAVLIRGVPTDPTHYQMIRAGAGYDPVIVVTPPGAGPDTEGAVFYEHRSWGEHRNQFKQIDARAAMMAFSGHADGWGWADLPKQTFADLDAVAAWIKS